MIIVETGLMLSGYKALTIGPFIFVHPGGKEKLSDVDINHEEIHWKQELEMLIVLFYVWYVLEFLVRLVVCWNWKKAYKSISLEQEAYDNELNLAYPRTRSLYTWTKYITKKW